MTNIFKKYSMQWLLAPLSLFIQTECHHHPNHEHTWHVLMTKCYIKLLLEATKHTKANTTISETHVSHHIRYTSHK